MCIGSQAISETSNVIFDIKKAGQITKKVLNEHFASLSDCLHAIPLQKVTERMFSAGLVSEPVKNSPDYNNLMSEYKVTLMYCDDCSEFVECCRSFVKILFEQGGPLKSISTAIANDWAKELKSQLHVTLNFMS